MHLENHPSHTLVVVVYTVYTHTLYNCIHPVLQHTDLSIANVSISLGNMGGEADAHNVKCKLHTVCRDEGATTSILILWFGSIGMNSSIHTSSPECERATSAVCALMVLQSSIA